MAEKQQEGGIAPPPVFEAAEDVYGGVMVELRESSMDSGHFLTVLRASLSEWRHQGKKGVWMKLSIQLACFVDAAVKVGRVLVPPCRGNIPNAGLLDSRHSPHYSFQCFSSSRNWCFRHEPNWPIAGGSRKQRKVQRQRGWKLPTGVVEQGEDICDAAVREVREETGIDTEFVEILAFRQSHNSFFGKSDLFFVCMLRPLSLTIDKQDTEIEKALWMCIDEYAAQPFVQKREMFNSIAQICLAKRDNEYTGFSAVPTTTGFSAKNTYLYCNRDWRE